MKKTIGLIAAAAMLLTSAAALHVSADDNGGQEEEKSYSDMVLNCEDCAPTIDGVIDDAYYQSFRVVHTFNRTYNEEERGLWPCGRFEVLNDDKSLNIPETAKKVEAYFADSPAEATSYFLWEQGHLYVAIEVKDSTPSFVLDEEYEKGANNPDCSGLYLIDGVMPKFTWPVQDITFSAYVDAGAHCGYVKEDSWVMWNKWGRDEKGSPKIKGHDVNKEDGLWAVSLTDDGYIVEMDFPVNTAVGENIFQEYAKNGRKTVGLFNYGLALCDSPTDFQYVRDQAKWADGIEERGFQSEDFIYLNDFGEFNSAVDAVMLTTEKVKPADDPVIPGDVNGDKVVDTKDLIRLMKYIASGGEGVEIVSPDLNGDEKVDTKDLIRLMKMIAGERPATDASTTDAPTTDAPTTDAPTTDAPTTDASTTDAPTSDTPAADAPIIGGEEL